MRYQEIITKLENKALHPKQAVMDAGAETGKDVFGCFPIYTPEEIIYASGMLPVGMWGGPTKLQLADKYLQSFCCCIMRSNIEYGMKGTYDMLKGVMIPTFCDTLKCICENWKTAVPNIPLLPVVYPQNRRLEAGTIYLIEELKRIKDQLEMLTGKTITEKALEGAWSLYESYRETMRQFVRLVADYPKTISARTRHLIIKAGYFMDKKDYIKDIQTIINGLAEQELEPFVGKKVVATGLLAEPIEVLHLFEENDIAFAADDLAQESRQFRTPGRDSGNVWQRMAFRIADQRGDTFLYEAEKTRGRQLMDLVQENRADGVAVFMMKFCDPEEFDYPVYKEELEAAGIPILYLEIDQQMSSFEQMRTRIQSFKEMLL